MRFLALIVLVASFLWTALPYDAATALAQDSAATKPSATDALGRTRFGTWLWGRNNTGNPHWLDGSVYRQVERYSLVDHMVFVPLDPQGRPASTSTRQEDNVRSSYCCARKDFWIDQARQMTQAGLDWVGIDSCGDHYDFYDDENPLEINPRWDPKQDRYLVPSMVMGIRESGVDLQICLFDDTPSYCNDYIAWSLGKKYPGRRANGVPEWMSHREEMDVDEPRMPVSAEWARRFLARKWVNFYKYMSKDKDLWLTHNGAHPDNGGRPVIFMYGANGNWFDRKTFGNWHKAFAAAKQAFVEAHGVEPWLVTEELYFTFDKHVPEVSEGQWAWFPLPGGDRPPRHEHVDPETGIRYVASHISPGFDLKGKPNPGHYMRKRWIARDGSEGDEAHHLRTEFALAMQGKVPDLMAIGHWNDWEEGQTWCLGHYPTKDGKKSLPVDYYIREVRKLIDATRAAQIGQPKTGDSSGKLSVATCQFPVSDDVVANATWIRDQMRQARRLDADIAHFPELALSGYAGIDHKNLDKFDWDAQRAELESILALARSLRLWVVLGAAHQLTGGHKPHNSLYVIDDRGRVIDRYDKRFCTGGDLQHYSPGDHFVTFELNGVRCGLLICYDVRFPELYRQYHKLGVQLLFHSFYNARQKPNSIHPKIVPPTVQARAATNYMFLSVNNSSGPRSWASLFVNPNGLIGERLVLDTPGVMVNQVDTAKRYYDASRRYRLDCIDGKWNSGQMVDDPRSKDRQSY